MNRSDLASIVRYTESANQAQPGQRLQGSEKMCYHAWNDHTPCARGMISELDLCMGDF